MMGLWGGGRQLWGAPGVDPHLGVIVGGGVVVVWGWVGPHVWGLWGPRGSSVLGGGGRRGEPFRGFLGGGEIYWGALGAPPRFGVKIPILGV